MSKVIAKNYISTDDYWASQLDEFISVKHTNAEPQQNNYDGTMLDFLFIFTEPCSLPSANVIIFIVNQEV